MKTGRERKKKRQRKSPRNRIKRLVETFYSGRERLAAKTFTLAFSSKQNKHKRKKLQRRGETTRKSTSGKSLDGWGKGIPYQTYEATIRNNVDDECPPPRNKEAL